jgi:hypothetical protein
MFTQRLQTALIALVLGIAPLATAQAQTVLQQTDPVAVLYGGGVNLDFRGHHIGTRAGAFSVQLGGDTISDPFYAFCVEMNAWFENNRTVTQGSVLDLNTGRIGNGGGVGWLYNNYASQITPGAADANLKATALQLAIWETVYDWNGAAFAPGGAAGAGLNFSTGDVRWQSGSDASVALATAWLNEWGGRTDADATWFQIENINGVGQDLVGRPSGGSARIPEPGTLALIGTGVAAAFLRRRK